MQHWSIGDWQAELIAITQCFALVVTQSLPYSSKQAMMLTSTLFRFMPSDQSVSSYCSVRPVHASWHLQCPRSTAHHGCLR